MTLTPRQIAAYAEFNAELDRLEHADRLILGAIAAQGDQKSIERTLRELDGNAKGQGRSRSTRLASDDP